MYRSKGKMQFRIFLINCNYFIDVVQKEEQVESCGFIPSSEVEFYVERF